MNHVVDIGTGSIRWPCHCKRFRAIIDAMAGIFTRAKDSTLLATLVRALPQIRARLADADAWAGLHVREPELDEEYLRIACKDDLVTGGAVPRKYRPAIHLFTQPGYEGRLHDHRWPIAVMPFDLEGRKRHPLYEMPWERREGGAVVQRGRMTVRSGEPWAIEACSDIFHGVSSLAPHLSVVIGDVTEPARRDNRLEVEPMTDEEVKSLLARAQQLIR